MIIFIKNFKNYFLLFLIFIIFIGFRGYGEKKEAEGVWFDISYPQKKENYYMEIDLEGNALMREKKGKKDIIKIGSIKKMYAKDFLREAKNSEIITEQKKEETKTLFYEGETINISIYINGELKRVNSPVKNFTDSFKFAFNELKQQIYKLNPIKEKIIFIQSIPLEGLALRKYNEKYSQDFKMKKIELKKLKTQNYLFKSISNPYRFIPIKEETEVSKIIEFINQENLPGMRSLFYIKTTRGIFQVSLLE